MIKHTQLNLYSFKEAIKNSDSYINIGNTSIKALYFKNKVLDRMYDNYQQAIKYGIEYLKQKPTLQVRDVNIINEILNK